MLKLDPNNPEATYRQLAEAAERAKFVSSEYHRNLKSKLGIKVNRRWPAASICHEYWTLEKATRALKDSIKAMQVSQLWENGMPKFVWCFDGEVLYEARLSNNVTGEYHGYPLESKIEWPRKLQKTRPS
jgi:hypothetical protein